MSDRVTVVADVREQLSRVPDQLRLLGAEVRQERLPVGDHDAGNGVLVERKSVRDLHLTLVNGRYWHQIGKLRRSARWPVLLVEGYRLDRGPVSADAIRGVCLATTEQGIVVLRAVNTADSAGWLLRLATRAQRPTRRDRPRFAQIPKSRPPERVPTAVLAAVPGVSTITARALLETFGSVAGIAAADIAALCTVEGVGKKRGTSIWEALHESSLSPSGPRSEGRDPST